MCMKVLECNIFLKVFMFIFVYMSVCLCICLSQLKNLWTDLTVIYGGGG